MVSAVESSGTGTLLHNARVITCDESRPRADWILVADGRIAELGTGEPPEAPAGVARRDLAGRTVVPGLIDGHTHLQAGGRRGRSELRLPAGLSTVAELAAELRAAAARRDPARWLIAGPVPTPVLMALDSLQSLAAIDDATGGLPVLLRDETLHNRVVNSAALARIEDFSVPGGAGRVATQDGRPTGVLWEQASLLGERAAAADSRADEQRDELLDAMRAYNAYGVTTVQDAATSLEAYELLASLGASGDATLRVVASLLYNDPGFAADPVGSELIAAVPPAPRPLLHRGFAKIFLDGVPSSQTAAYHRPYASASEHPHGVLNLDGARLTAALLELGRAGLGAKIHVLGDRAVSVAIAAVDEARREGYRGIVQLAHAKNISPAEIIRLPELDICIDASPPVWHPSSITSAIERELGPDIAHFRSPHRTMLDFGTRVFGGTDWPVIDSPSPWYGIESMVTRADPTGRYPGTLWADQAITVGEALRAHTSAAAEALGLGHLTGRIAAGLSADLAVLDRDPCAVPARRLHEIRALETMLAGTTVHRAPLPPTSTE